MRLLAQAKCGFYPAAPEAVSLALKHLAPPKGHCAILDPCCGQAAALAQLGEGLGCKPTAIYGVELDEGRAALARERLPKSPIMGPASFLGTAISYGSLSFAWVNPPFDDEIGGGKRVETDFAVRAIRLLVKDGVLCLVCPAKVLEDRWELRRTLNCWLHTMAVLPFPEEHRPYGEVMVFGIKRDKPIDGNADDADWSDSEAGVYQLPRSPGPGRFEKSEMTEPELQRALAASPLRRFMEVIDSRPPARPPLPLATGHLALLLASGALDGVVAPPGEMPHLVRGTAKKEEYVSSTEEVVNNKGDTVGTRTTFDQTIKLLVRTLDNDGTLRTLTMGQGGKNDVAATDQ